MKRVLLSFVLAAAAMAEEPSPVEDANFMLESGWNRDDAVLQYTAFFLHGERAVSSELVGEWAMSSPRHQLSYTLPFYTDGRTGLGDAMFNYRYQFVGESESRIGIAPRVSLILPTRSEHFGGSTSGVQVVVPISAALGERITSHTNLGAAWFDARARELSVAQSFVFAPHRRIALSLDANYTGALVVRPRFEVLLDVAGVQFAPGIAVTRDSLLLSVSLERSLR
jgi:hypothetical protein